MIEQGPGSTSAVNAVVARCRDVLGPSDRWQNPVGYRESLALSILDSVWSLASDYDAHVVPVLDRYRGLRRAAGGDPSTDGARDLIELAEAVGGPEALAGRLDNHQRTSTHAGAPLKSVAVVLAAEALVAAGIDTADEFRAAVACDPERVRSAWRRTPGQRSSSIGWRYLLLLLGEDEVKPDRMVQAFLASCDLPGVTPDAAAALVSDAARELGVPARVLDHAIWRYQRSIGRGSRAPRVRKRSLQ